MNILLLNVFSAVSSTSDGGSGSSGSGTSSSTEKLVEALKGIVKNPVFYIVIALIVLLIVGVYVLRRFVKATPGTVKVVIRNGKIYKLVDDKSPKYFMVPFKDRLGGVIGLGEKDLATDKLFINNGPDALYKLNLSLRYKLNDIEAFFPYRDNIADLAIKAINVDLREYADEGHALDIVKDYRKNESLILGLLNKSVEKYSIEVVSFKINYIEPVGKR